VNLLVHQIAMRGLVPPDWTYQTWQDEYRMFMESVENQKSLLYFLLVFIMLVAAICVMNTIITVTVQKRREIGIMTALGAPARQVVAIFLTQASVVAVLGVAFGIAGGMLALELLNPLRDLLASWFELDIFPQEVYFLSSIPSDIDTADLTRVSLLAVALCLLAALLPAWVAGRVDPAVALRD
jgi:lipoprotein-releasing system permease protein